MTIIKMMDGPSTTYEPLYLAGVQLFNSREFFECHEVLEDLWNECRNEDRRFYQAVLQAAVALHHFNNGNLRGAAKLYGTAKAYMDPYPNPYYGLDKETFWRDMGACFAEIFVEGQDMLRRDLHPVPELIPSITLDPLPACWPDPYQYLRDDE